MTDQASCAFCKIVAGEESVEVVCQTEEWLAFFPDSPATAGHTLVIPKMHLPDFLALGPKIGANIMEGIVRVANAIREALRPDGMNLISSSGEAADQSVYHLHFHVVPRTLGDRIGHIWPPGEAMDEEVKEGLADLIRAKCLERASEWAARPD